MFLQAIYIFWKYLVRSIAIIGVLLFVAGVIALIILQISSTRTYFIDSIESNFQSKYHGQLHIESIEGFIPFNATIHNISFLYQEDDLIAPNAKGARQEAMEILQHTPGPFLDARHIFSQP